MGSIAEVPAWSDMASWHGNVYERYVRFDLLRRGLGMVKDPAGQEEFLYQMSLNPQELMPLANEDSLSFWRSLAWVGVEGARELEGYEVHHSPENTNIVMVIQPARYATPVGVRRLPRRMAVMEAVKELPADACYTQILYQEYYYFIYLEQLFCVKVQIVEEDPLIKAITGYYALAAVNSEQLMEQIKPAGPEWQTFFGKNGSTWVKRLTFDGSRMRQAI